MLFRTDLTLALALAVALPANAQPRSPAAAMNPSAWQIGPIIRGRNHSQGMPPRPSPHPRGGWYFDIPQRPGSVHYVTFAHGPLAGKKRIVMRYRVEAAPGTRILPRTDPNFPSIITLYFQRRGDDWSGRGRFETYRWYATFASQTPIRPGEHQIIAPLGANWTAIQTSSARSNPAAFGDALANAERVGFVLGGGDGYGHGIFATGPARLTVTDFRIE